MMSKAAIMFQRVVFGVVAILVLVMLFQLDRTVAERALEIPGRWGELLRHGSVIPILFLVVFLAGATEMDRLLRARGERPLSFFAYTMIAALLLLPWLSPAGVLGFSIADREGMYWPLAGAAASILGVGTLCVLRNNPTESLRDGAGTLLMIFYLGFLGSFGLQLRCGVDTPTQQGVWVLLIVILVTKCSDIGAYFLGSAIGRHKLIPKVSPGKSVEGAFGGIVGSGLAACLCASADRFARWFGASTHGSQLLNEAHEGFGRVFHNATLPAWAGAFIFGAILSIAAQIGDLFESCFKRDAGIKDSGAIMPHYGGILDLVDSPLFAMPVAWFLLTRVWNGG